MGQRQHDAAFDHALLGFHAGHLVPEALAHDPAAECGQQSGVGGSHVVDPVEVAKIRPFGVPAVEKCGGPGGVLGQQSADAPRPQGAHPLLQLGEQCTADAAVTPPTAQRDHRDPGTFAADLGDRHADELIVDDRHHGRLTTARGRDHLRDREGGGRLGRLPALIPDRDGLVEVVVVEVA